MADNTVLPAGVGGDSIRDIDRAGIKTQVAQIDVGGTAAESLVTAANPMPVTLASGAATSALQTSGNVSTASLDTKTPALGQALAAASSPVVLTAAQIITLTPLATVAVTSAGLTNLDVALSTRLKPADTLTGITTVAAVTAITNALPAGTNRIGSVRPVDSADADLTSAKSTQTARFAGVQRSIDAGRNGRIFMLDAITAAPLVEALATVVQWYGNAAVAGTTTPAVVPAGKVLRLSSWKIQYQSLATVGYAVVRVRCNVAGAVVLASPLVYSFEAGTNSGATTAAVTGATTTASGDFPEGFEIPAAAGIGFTIAGYGPTGALTLEGGVRFAVAGYEY